MCRELIHAGPARFESLFQLLLAISIEIHLLGDALIHLGQTFAETGDKLVKVGAVPLPLCLTLGFFDQIDPLFVEGFLDRFIDLCGDGGFTNKSFLRAPFTTFAFG